MGEGEKGMWMIKDKEQMKEEVLTYQADIERRACPGARVGAAR